MSKKTKFVLFSSRTTKTLSKESVLTIRKNEIERVTSVRLLGVIFNERLTWKDHMAMLISKLKSSLYAVMGVKPSLTQKALLTLFHSLILSHIRYCITTWCYGHSVLLNKLQKICKKFINMIICSNPAKKRNKEITKDNILNIQQLYNYFFYFISIFILLTRRNAMEALIHRVSNYPDLLPEMPKYCCPLVI